MLHLYRGLEKFYEELNQTVEQIDRELDTKPTATTYDDNSEKLFSLFGDFLVNGLGVLKHNAVLFGLMIGDRELETMTGMSSFLKKLQDPAINKMMNEDLIWGKDLTDLRNEIEHLRINNLHFFGYEIDYHDKVDNKPLLKVPRFKYKDRDEIQISDYLWGTYVNIFTFVEDTIAIAFNKRIEKLPMKLLKSIDDGGKLDSKTNVYTMHMISKNNTGYK